MSDSDMMIDVVDLINKVGLEYEDAAEKQGSSESVWLYRGIATGLFMAYALLRPEESAVEEV